jgi:hypothetical protein
MCFSVSSFFGSPLTLSPFSFLWGLSSEAFIGGFISSLPQRNWDNKKTLLLLLLYARSDMDECWIIPWDRFFLMIHTVNIQKKIHMP